MAGYFSNLALALVGRRESVSPYSTAGVPGTAVHGGYVENKERRADLAGGTRYITASDLLANTSIVAAGMRFFLNLCARPSWSFEPAEDNGEGEEPSDNAKLAADFANALLGDMDTAWGRIVRRSGMYRFHGFGIQEWTAKRRKDGLVGLLDIEPRPCHTISKWDREPHGKVLGVFQNSPETGEEIYLPRDKLVYLVDDVFTDSPEGMGFFRHLVEPARRLDRYLKLEGTGFERDLRGIPIGRAPIAEINGAVKNGVLTKEEGERMIEGIKSFVRMQVKSEDTGIVIDSKAYEGQTADGTTVSGTAKWGVELLTASGGGLEALNGAIGREIEQMARIIGVENLLLGSGPSGSRALSEDKSRNLYLNVSATVGDLSEGLARDVIDPVWMLNGFPDELKPKPKVEDVSPKDVETISAMLRDMAAAGAVLTPDDPAIDDLRDLAGISRQPEMTEERKAILMPPPPQDDPDQGDPDQGASGKPPAKEKGKPGAK